MKDRNNSITGIFYHPSFSRRSYLTVGRRLEDFPRALQPLLDTLPLKMYNSPRVDRELLLKVHHPAMIEAVGRDHWCSTAWESAGGAVFAGEEIWRERLRNAFVFIGAGGHHAGFDYFGGACCFNDVVLAARRLREMKADLRIAILDTDAHHGDGTRELLEDDPLTLHCCVCSSDYRSADGLKMDIAFHGSGRNNPDEAYLGLVENVFVKSLAVFRPDFLFWYFGYDTHAGDYGSVGLSGRAFFELARLMVREAQNRCHGKLEVVLAGGSRTDLATALIPEIISILTEGGIR